MELYPSHLFWLSPPPFSSEKSIICRNNRCCVIQIIWSPGSQTNKIASYKLAKRDPHHELQKWWPLFREAILFWWMFLIGNLAPGLVLIILMAIQLPLILLLGLVLIINGNIWEYICYEMTHKVLLAHNLVNKNVIIHRFLKKTCKYVGYNGRLKYVWFIDIYDRYFSVLKSFLAICKHTEIYQMWAYISRCVPGTYISRIIPYQLKFSIPTPHKINFSRLSFPQVINLSNPQFHFHFGPLPFHEI